MVHFRNENSGRLRPVADMKHPLNQGLIYWGSGKALGETARWYDMSPYQTHADLGTGGTWFFDGAEASYSGAHFDDDANDIIDVPNKSVFDSDNFSIEVSFKTDTIPGFSNWTILSRQQSTLTQGYTLDIASTGELEIWVNDAFEPWGLTGANVIQDNTRYHAVVTWSETDNEARLWVNGVNETGSSFYNWAAQTASNNALEIGGSDHVGQNYGGEIFDVRIYDRGLSDGERRALYEAYLEEYEHLYKRSRPRVTVAGGTTVSIIVQDAIHSHTADQPAITQTHEMTVQESLHSHAADPTSITQTHVIDTAEALHSHASDNVTIAITHEVVVQESLHSHAADQPGLTQTHVIVSAESLHGHIADSPALSQTHEISTDESIHSHSADEPSVTQTHEIVSDEALHSHAADEPTVSQAQEIETDEALHSHTADQPGISQTHVISTDESLHTHTADQPGITQTQVIVTNEAAHSHIADEPGISQTHAIVTAEAIHSHSADEPTLSQTHEIATDEALHSHTADNITIVIGGVNILSQDALHGHAADSPAITQTHILVVQESLHSQASDNTTIGVEHEIAVEESLHSHSADNATVDSIVSLVINEALHGHSADLPNLTQTQVIVAQEALHAHSAANIVVTIGSSGTNLDPNYAFIFAPKFGGSATSQELHQMAPILLPRFSGGSQVKPAYEYRLTLEPNTGGISP